MPRLCSVCAHSERAAIDAALLSGDPYRNIAERFGTSATALTRHKLGHIPAHLSRAMEAEAVADAGDLLGQVRGLQTKALQLLDKAERAGDYRTALAGVREARACVALLAEVEGQLDRRTTVNILLSSEWLSVRTALMVALRPHPEAAAAVAASLKTLGDGT